MPEVLVDVQDECPITQEDIDRWNLGSTGVTAGDSWYDIPEGVRLSCWIDLISGHYGSLDAYGKHMEEDVGGEE